MSGPVTTEDVPPDAGCGTPHAPEVDLLPSRDATVGGLGVRRALPRRLRRTVGAWCFADHFGPAAAPASMAVGPHPHTGLHTVTWLAEGEVLHRDSLGSEQLIRPGQLNLMTAGHGVAHAEETLPGFSGGLHGIQLWVAQPEATRHGAAAFEHHAELPSLALGPSVATVLVGELGGARSPARADTPLVGAELTTTGGPTVVPLAAGFEHALVMLDGTVAVGGETFGPGVLAYLGEGRDELRIEAPGPARALLLGGEPLAEQIVMGWNFVGRSHDEVERAGTDWNAGAERFGTVASALPRIPAPAARP
ncbi:MAG TPA: pirin family protein [Acidimicrobiales bacterium]|nr:pirin family protein [Acidimicrobiales bacterium]